MIQTMQGVIQTTKYKQPERYPLYGPNSTWLDSTRLDTLDFVEPCYSNMADDEEAVVLACTSLVFCA